MELKQTPMLFCMYGKSFFLINDALPHFTTFVHYFPIRNWKMDDRERGGGEGKCAQ